MTQPVRSYKLDRGEPDRAARVAHIRRIFTELTGVDLSLPTVAKFGMMGTTEFAAVYQHWRDTEARFVRARERDRERLATIEERASQSQLFE